ncbi:MAG: DsbC family protein [Proteobacteria bacterium]|nr:DsbC family protein [Pseudomonadota bacterium]
MAYPTPVEGLFEVVTRDTIFYFAPATGHLLFGDLWSKDGANLTAAREERVLAEKVARLPLDQAVKLGDGPTVVIEISDPGCPSCQVGNGYLGSWGNLTRYVFFHPLASHPGARAKAQYILTAPDPATAHAEVFGGWYDEEPLPEVEPTGRLAEHIRLIEGLGIRGTPHYWIGGEHVAGADLDAIRNLLP